VAIITAAATAKLHGAVRRENGKRTSFLVFATRGAAAEVAMVQTQDSDLKRKSLLDQITALQSITVARSNRDSLLPAFPGACPAAMRRIPLLGSSIRPPLFVFCQAHRIGVAETARRSPRGKTRHGLRRSSPKMHLAQLRRSAPVCITEHGARGAILSRPTPELAESGSETANSVSRDDSGQRIRAQRGVKVSVTPGV
jgi:hypothetical protein